MILLWPAFSKLYQFLTMNIRIVILLISLIEIGKMYLMQNDFENAIEKYKEALK